MREHETAFRELYLSAYTDLTRFVRRRVGPDRADDVVAETFTIAWRRIAEVPQSHDQARAWLFGVARNVMLNEARGADRHRALAVRLAYLPDAVPMIHSGESDLVATRVDVEHAWGQLSDDQREVIALTAWDGLSSKLAAQVLGITAVAYRLRLSRARNALRGNLNHPIKESTGIEPIMAQPKRSTADVTYPGRART